ncbi:MULTISPECIES: hypothetical protein [unclassified Nonomuraea]|uniref:hypothetical protein n=1 Tax=unclassified Nonomuraea TaxID=2593643 RepID=UPI0033F39693
MTAVVIPMHPPSGGTVQLHRILGVLPENTWAWSIFDLWAVGVAPRGMTMPAFEDLVQTSATGYRMTWRELTDAASRLDQVHDCLIVAADSPHLLSRPLSGRPGLLVVIEALDSGRWEVEISERLDGADAMRERLASLVRGPGASGRESGCG